MKFWKWFSFQDEGASEARIADEYRRMSDHQLARIDPSELTPIGRRIRDEEIARRKEAAKAQERGASSSKRPPGKSRS